MPITFLAVLITMVAIVAILVHVTVAMTVAVVHSAAMRTMTVTMVHSASMRTMTVTMVHSALTVRVRVRVGVVRRRKAIWRRRNEAKLRLRRKHLRRCHFCRQASHAQCNLQYCAFAQTLTNSHGFLKLGIRGDSDEVSFVVSIFHQNRVCICNVKVQSESFDERIIGGGLVERESSHVPVIGRFHH